MIGCPSAPNTRFFWRKNRTSSRWHKRADHRPGRNGRRNSILQVGSHSYSIRCRTTVTRISRTNVFFASCVRPFRCVIGCGSDQNRWPVKWMKTSSSVGLPSVIDSMRSGNASTSRGIHWWPLGCSSRTEPSTTFAVDVELLLDFGGQAARVVGANRDGVAADGRLQRDRRIERGQIALVHDRDAVGPLGFVQQMRREDDRHAVALADLLQVLPQVAARARIEAGRRLVEQQQPRAMQHAGGQFDAPPQAAGKLFRPARACDRRGRAA